MLKTIKNHINRKLPYWLALLFFFILFNGLKPQVVSASELQPGKTAVEVKEESFDTGGFVIEHISDAFEWHIATIGDVHLSIPLPIILYSKTSGWHVFLSSRFHHGTDSWKNFSIAHEGENAGKIVETDKGGNFIGLPVDLSITKVVTGIIVSVILIFWIFIGVGRSAARNAGGPPKGMRNIVEIIVIFIRDEVAKPAIGEKKLEKFLPFLLTLFFFILINNLMGLIPIIPFGANVTGNLSVTMVLALSTFLVTNLYGNKHYWKEIFNPDVPWWMKFPVPLMPVVEFMGVITKPIVLMVRLFANMLAGHMVITIFVSLIFVFSNMIGAYAGVGFSIVSVGFSVFMTMLEILVSFIQAYVFTLLSALYFGMANTESH